MNRYVNIGLACGMSAFLGAAVDLSAQAKPQTAQASHGTASAQAGTSVNLGAVRIPRAVKADGQALPAGTYQVRVTETPASPPAAGQTPQYERWAEFLRNGKVVAREVVTIVPGERHQAGRRADAAAGRRIPRRGAQGKRLPAAVDQPRRESLPDSLQYLN